MKKLWQKVKLSFDRSFSGSWWRQLLWLAGVALGLILIGWVILLCLDAPAGLSWWKSMAYFFDTDSFHRDHEIDMQVPALFSVLFTFLGMTVMSGALISVIVNILTNRVDDFRRGHIRYGFRGHVVILGSGEMVANMARHFCTGSRYAGRDIVVLTTSDVPELREKLHSTLTREQERRITLLYGRRDSAEELTNIRIWRAAGVYIIGEKGEPEHDTANIHALELVRDICAAKGNARPLPCSVIFEYQPSLLIMQYAGYNSVLTEKDGRKVIDLHVTNLYEDWAQNVLVSGRSGDIVYAPLDRGRMTAGSGKRVHLVVAGMGRMGRAMAETAAHIAHYPNFGPGTKTLITFIDPDARREMDYFTGRHESLFALSEYSFVGFEGAKAKRERFRPERGNNFLDVEWEFIGAGLEHPEVRRMLARWSLDDTQLLTLALCANSSPANISAALYLPQQLYDAKIPVLVYQSGDSALVDIARRSGKYSELRAFGMQSAMFDPESERRTLTAQRIMYVYDHFYANGTFARSLPSDSELAAAWNAASLPLQWSNLYMANTIPTKYRSLGLDPSQAASHDFTEEEVAALSRMEHRRWNMEKLLLGYRPVTPEEDAAIAADPTLKTRLKEEYFAHCDIRPFDDLRTDQTGKNASEYDRCIVEGLKMIMSHPKQI